MNYYILLDIPQNASKLQIKRAYFSKVKIHTPDKDPDNFRLIRTAYEILMDDLKRKKYDETLLSTTGLVQDELLSIKEMLTQNKYKEASEKLSVLHNKHPDDRTVALLYADTLITIRKTAPAEKICKALLENNPGDGLVLNLIAKIALSRGHTNKAEEYFEQAVSADPNSPRIWLDYLKYCEKQRPWSVEYTIKRALEISEDMLVDEYRYYLIYILDFDEDEIKDEGEHLSRFLKRFVDCFIADTQVTKAAYDAVVHSLSHLSDSHHFMPELIRLYPALEKSKHFNEEHEYDLKGILAVITAYELIFKDKIHTSVAYLTMNLLLPEEDKGARLETETSIVFSLDEVRPSIRKLRKEHPKLYELNAAFYRDCLEPKKEENLMNKYAKKTGSINPSGWTIPIGKPSNNMSFFDDDYEEDVIIETIRREQPKIGRNEPCPCGSGKKYKKCCG